MPPNSFCEWVVGQNVRPRTTSGGPRPVFSLQLETDDEYESDVIKLTYPRTSRTRQPHGKKVRFSDSTTKVETGEPLAQSIQPIQPIQPVQRIQYIQTPLDADTDASSTAVEVSSSDDEAAIDQDLILDCPCTNCIAAQRRLNNTKQAKGKDKKHSAGQSENHAAVVHARHKAKKAKEAESLKCKRVAKKKAKKTNEKSSRKVETDDSTAGSGGESDNESETRSESESESEPEFESEEEIPKKRGKKSKGGYNKHSSRKKRDGQSRKASQSEKYRNKNKQETMKSRDSIEIRDDQEDTRMGDTKKNEEAARDGTPKDRTLQEADAITKQRVEANQYPPRYPPQYPPYAPQQANFLMPPHPRMLQVEHAIELPNDPRPNAFFDGAHGIMRVYHGPHYGNAYGQLYPNAPYVNHNPTFNVSYPAHNPWQAAGFQPFPGGQPPLYPPPQPQPPPHARPQQPPVTTQRTPVENPWFRGYGSVTIGKPHEEVPEVSGPNFTPEINQGNNEHWHGQHGTPTRKPTGPAKTNSRSDHGGKSNVIPSIEVTAPEKPQDGEGAGSKPWDTQSAHGSHKAWEFKEEGKNDNNDAEQAEQDRRDTSFNDVIAKAEALYNRVSSERSERSQRISPVPKADSNQTGNGGFDNNNDTNWANSGGWGDSNNDATVGDITWGDNPQETSTAAAEPSKPTEGNSNGNSSEPAGGNGSIDNVMHGDPSSNDNNNDSKNGGGNGQDTRESRGRGRGKKRLKGVLKRNTSPTGLPGCWVSNPPSENEDPKPFTSPDNVGPPASGNGNGKKDKGKSKGNPKEKEKSDNNQDSAVGWGDWADPNVAQSSGGVFEEEDEEANKDGKEQQDIAW
ncbi:hypothetical protein F5Y11DRAFT_307674 [Daldinia sp. FL1419]|nr:hypothetical protein F5Y11DRAFT_307674 [Daldinia sp. FL1419]